MTIETNLKIFFGFVFGLIFLGVILVSIYFKNLRRLFDYLKNNYPEKYKELGEPSLFMNMSPRNTLRVLKYLRQSSQSKDIILESLKNKIKTLLLTFIIIFIIGVLCVLMGPLLIIFFSA